MKIVKYKLWSNDSNNVAVPYGAVPLCVKMQGEDAYVWILLDENAKIPSSDYMRFLAFVTGHGSVRGSYLGTLHTSDRVDLHVFYEWVER